MRIMGVMVAALTVAGCVTGQQRLATIETGATVALAPSEVEAVQRGVKGSLKDPGSAQFGAVAASRDSTGTVTVCGYVNARNGFGGYAGPKPFAGVLYGGQFAVADIGSTDASTAAVLITCNKAGATI